MPEENMKSLAKTLDILEAFLHGTDEMSVTEISKRLGLNKATVSRIMSKLLKRRYLKQIEKRGKYSLGAIFLEYSGIIKRRLKIRDVVIPYLLRLSREVKESAMLAAWDRRDVASVVTETFHDTAYLDSPLRVVPDEGVTMPLYCTCLGKMLLASLTEKELEAYFKSVRLERRTPKTLIDIKAITEELIGNRCDGVAFDDEEYALGVRGVAAAVVNNQGETVGSIGIVVPTARLSMTTIRELAPTVKSYALEVSKQLGYRG